MTRIIYQSELRESSGGYVSDFALLISDEPFRFSKITYHGEVMFEKGRGGPWAGFFISYDGSQKQPDPILNAAMSGNAPVYRGKSYVVFNDLPFPQDFRPYEAEFWPPESATEQSPEREP